MIRIAMIKSLSMKILLSVGLLFVFSSSYADSCALPDPVSQMDIKTIKIFNDNTGVETQLSTRIADSQSERMAGFQHVCVDQVDDYPILFVFDVNRESGFHMNNVKSDLMIAFLDEAGMIVDIQRMSKYEPGGDKKITVSAKPFRYALELAPSVFESLNLTVGHSYLEL